MNLEHARNIFGLKYRISEDEFKTVYRKLAISKHPDTNKSPRAKEEFQELQLAYRILKNNLSFLPRKPKPKPDGDTIWRIFNNKNNKQEVILPDDIMVDNDVVLYFLYRDIEYRIHLKKELQLPTIIKIEGIDLMLEIKRGSEKNY